MAFMLISKPPSTQTVSEYLYLHIKRIKHLWKRLGWTILQHHWKKVFQSIHLQPRMPYILISTLIRLECGPTIVGDEWSDPEMMEFLGAKLIHEFGNNFKEYRSPDPPRKVLNLLESRGYRVIGMTGIGQSCIWTCYRENEDNTDNNRT